MNKYIGFFSFQNKQNGEVCDFTFGVEAEDISEVRDKMRDGVMLMAESEDDFVPGSEIYLEGIVKLIDFDAKGQLISAAFRRKHTGRATYEFGHWPMGAGVQVFTRDESAFEEPFVVVPLTSEVA